MVIMTDLTTVTDYVKVFNDAEFRQSMRDSLSEKRNNFALLKLAIVKYKELLETDTREDFEQNNINIAYFKPFWEATWFYLSRPAIRKATELANQISKLDLALGIAVSLSEDKEFKRGKYTEVQVEEANSYPVEDLISGTVRKSGKRYMACCPLHKEDTPSFVIFEDNSWHCFGCGKHGTGAIGFVMDRDNVDFKVAVERILR